MALGLGQARHVIDMRTGVYLGHMEKVERQMQPGEVELLSALPYRVTAAHGEMARGRGGDGDGLPPPAPNAPMKAISGRITVQSGPDGAPKDCKPPQTEAIDRPPRRGDTDVRRPRTVLGICDMGNVGLGGTTCGDIS